MIKAARAFERLNLRCNPFGEPSLEDRAQLAEVAAFDLKGVLAQHAGFVVQLIGPEGAGKTTHLLGVLHQFPSAVYEYIPEGQRKVLSTLQANDLFLLDEGQRLYSWRLRWLFRRVQRLIVATHEDLRRYCPRAMQTVIMAPPTAHRLQTLFTARIQWAQKSPGPVPKISQATIEDLQHRWGHNIRAMEAELYERFQILDGLGDEV